MNKEWCHWNGKCGDGKEHNGAQKFAHENSPPKNFQRLAICVRSTIAQYTCLLFAVSRIMTKVGGATAFAQPLFISPVDAD